MRAEDSIIEMDLESGSKFKPLMEDTITEENEIEEDTMDYKMIQTYKISKTIKVYSGIDTIINALYVFYNPWYIIPTLISVLGYFGALEYNTFMLCVYFIYQIVMIFTRVGLNIDSWIHTRYELGPLVIMVIGSILLTFFDIYITRFIFIMIKYIKTFSQDDILKLKRAKEIKTKFLYW